MVCKCHAEISKTHHKNPQAATPKSRGFLHLGRNMRKHSQNRCADLEQQRKAIDLLDAELVRLLNHRAQIAGTLARIKQSSGLPIHDLQREQQILKRICRQNQGPLNSEALIRIFRNILRESRKLQESSLQQTRTNFVQQENIHGDQYGSKRIRS